MSFTTRIVNPTPFHVSWPWHRGVVLEIPAFEFLDVGARIMEQLMPDEPGYDGIKQLMNHYGVFLDDPSKTYEAQAAEAIRNSIKVKEALYTDCSKNIRARAAQSGNISEDAIKSELENSGYTRLVEEVKKLNKVLKVIEEKLGITNRTMHQQYDPERTLLFTNPPKEFPSKLAMQLFLSQPENADLMKQYQDYMKQMKGKDTKSSEKE